MNAAGGEPELRIVPAAPADFERVYPLLRKFGNARLERAQWQRLFDHAWSLPGEPRGFMLLQGEAVKGFLGLVFSHRTIDGADARFCNMTSWIVEPECRNQSIAMLRRVVALPDTTLTNFTASAVVSALLQRFGFEVSPLRLRVLLPWPFPGSSVACEFDPDAIVPRLGAEHARYLRDHLAYGCTPVLMGQGAEAAFALVKPFEWRIRSHGIRAVVPLARVHYGHGRAFPRLLSRARRAICRQSKVRGVLVEERLLGAERPFASFAFPEAATLLLRSRSVEAAAVDTLYSEMVLLHQ